MSVFKFFPSQDASIYTLYSNDNTVLDEYIKTAQEAGLKVN